MEGVRGADGRGGMTWARQMGKEGLGERRGGTKVAAPGVSGANGRRAV
jgi:hypothetical protein